MYLNTYFGLLLAGLLIFNYRNQSCEKSQQETVWRNFEYAIITGTAIISVALFEALVDAVLWRSMSNSKRMLPLLVPRIFVLTGIFLSNVYIVHKKESYASKSGFWRLQSFQAFCLLHGCFAIAGNIVEQRLFRILSNTVQISVGIADILLLENNMQLNFYSYFGMFSFLFLLLSMGIFIFLFGMYCYHICGSNKANANSTWSHGEFILLVLTLIIASIVFIIWILLAFSCCGEALLPVTPNLVEVQLYTISILSVFLSMAHSRIFRCSNFQSFEVS